MAADQQGGAPATVQPDRCMTACLHRRAASAAAPPQCRSCRGVSGWPVRTFRKQRGSSRRCIPANPLTIGTRCSARGATAVARTPQTLPEASGRAPCECPHVRWAQMLSQPMQTGSTSHCGVLLLVISASTNASISMVASGDAQVPNVDACASACTHAAGHHKGLVRPAGREWPEGAPAGCCFSMHEPTSTFTY